DEVEVERFNFERALGAKLVEEIMSAGPDEAQLVLDKVLSASRKEIASQVLNIFVSVAAIVLTIAAFTFSGPLAPIILGAVGTALGMLYLVIDLKSMSGEMNSPIGKYDAIWVYASALFSALLVTMALLVATNPYVVAIIAVTALLILIVHVACMVRVHSA
nr:hypothetical protein [Chlamydiota bacterium]